MKYTIIGGGIGGLTTALAFEQKGIDYQVFEKAPELSEIGAGIWLAPNALQVLDSLNVLNEILSTGNSINRITLGKADLSPLSDQSQDGIKDKYGYTTVAIHRAQLQKILLKKLPQEKVHLGKGFHAFKELDTGKIEVHFTDKTSIETDYLIGADGIHSKVRHQLFPESKLRYSGQTCWRGIADIQLDSDFEHRGVELWGGPVRFGFSRVDNNRVYWFAVAVSDAQQKDEGEIKNKLLDMYKNFHPLVHTLIQSTEHTKILRHDINDLNPLNTWYTDKVCLIGDAGHATTPNMGQGGAQAIEDAYYLSQFVTTHLGKDLFKHFQDKRQKKVNTIVNQSWTTGKMAHWTYGKGVRNFLMKNIPKTLLEKKMMEMYEL